MSPIPFSVRSQMPLGDKDDPAHTETWESPLITIDRP